MLCCQGNLVSSDMTTVISLTVSNPAHWYYAWYCHPVPQTPKYSYQYQELLRNIMNHELWSKRLGYFAEVAI